MGVGGVGPGAACELGIAGRQGCGGEGLLDGVGLGGRVPRGGGTRAASARFCMFITRSPCSTMPSLVPSFDLHADTSTRMQPTAPTPCHEDWFLSIITASLPVTIVISRLPNTPNPHPPTAYSAYIMLGTSAPGAPVWATPPEVGWGARSRGASGGGGGSKGIQCSGCPKGRAAWRGDGRKRICGRGGVTHRAHRGSVSAVGQRRQRWGRREGWGRGKKAV